jgi:hypothetical protein
MRWRPQMRTPLNRVIGGGALETDHAGRLVSPTNSKPNLILNSIGRAIASIRSSSFPSGSSTCRLGYGVPGKLSCWSMPRLTMGIFPMR